MRKRELALVGCGWWGKNLLRNLAEMDVLKRVVEKNGDLRGALAPRHPGIVFSADMKDALDDPDVRGLVIATPASTHFELARRALECGRDVFVEKPLALTAAEGMRLAERAEKDSRILMVGHILHYHPAVRELKRIAASGVMGKLLYAYSTRLNIGRIRREENILWSFAPHDISMLLAIAGELPDEVRSFGETYLHHSVEDVTLTYLRFPGGLRGHIFVSWLHPVKEQRFILVGERKMAVFDDTAPEHKLCLYGHRICLDCRGLPEVEKARPEPVPVGREEPLRCECEEFVSCMRERRQPLTDGQEAVKVLQVLERAEASLKETRPRKT